MKIKKGLHSYSETVYTFDGQYVRYYPSDEIAYTLDGNRLREGQGYYGTVRYTIEGDCIYKDGSLKYSIHGDRVVEGACSWGAIVYGIEY